MLSSAIRNILTVCLIRSLKVSTLFTTTLVVIRALLRRVMLLRIVVLGLMPRRLIIGRIKRLVGARPSLADPILVRCRFKLVVNIERKLQLRTVLVIMQVSVTSVSARQLPGEKASLVPWTCTDKAM